MKKNINFVSLVSKEELFVIYRVSQQVWNRLKNVCDQSEFSFTKKYVLWVLCSKKLLFEPFFPNCKIGNGFLSNFSPILNNLLNKLLYKIIGEKFLKIPFSFLQFTKNGSKSNFMEHNTYFVEKPKLS